MKEVRTKKKKHMTKDMNEMKKKRGRPALGRTRKLTKGVTVKFSPVSYEALRFRAGCNLQIFLCLFLEKLNMPQNTPVTKAS